MGTISSSIRKEWITSQNHPWSCGRKSESVEASRFIKDFSTFACKTWKGSLKITKNYFQMVSRWAISQTRTHRCTHSNVRLRNSTRWSGMFQFRDTIRTSSMANIFLFVWHGLFAVGNKNKITTLSGTEKVAVTDEVCDHKTYLDLKRWNGHLFATVFVCSK